METMYKLLKIIQDFGYNTQKFNRSGLDNWNKLKPLLQQNKQLGLWKSEILSLYDMMKSLNIHGGDNDEKLHQLSHETWEKYHFLFQHGRIPHNYKNNPSLERLCQIVFNSGQLCYHLDNNDPIVSKFRDFSINENKLFNIETFMSEKYLNQFEISDEFINIIEKTCKND